MAIKTVAGPMTITLTGFGQLQVEGDHTYNLGKNKRTAIQGPNGVIHGFKSEPQMAKIAGKIIFTDVFSQYLEAFLEAESVTVTLKLPNGGVFILSDAFQSGDGEGSTENGTINYELTGTGFIQQ